MKVCVSLRDPAPEDLRAGNLRSEGRWERQVLEALVQNPLVSDIYTIGCHWSCAEKTTTKYRGAINAALAKDTILLVQDFDAKNIQKYNFKSILVNIFHGPWEQSQQIIKDLVNQYQDRFMFTIGYAGSYQGQVEYLKQFLDPKNIVVLSVPAVPETYPNNNFNESILLWPYRIVHFQGFYDRPVVEWALQKLEKDETLQFHVVTGWTRDEAKDYVNGCTVPLTRDLNDVFWDLPQFQKYIGLKSRTKFMYSIPWVEILSIYSKTKLMLPHSVYNGGPPCEAAMYGVPFVGTGSGVTFKECSGFLSANTPEEHMQLLDKLLTDEQFYIQTSNTYRTFVQNNYTYEAFNTNLNNLLFSRGLI